GEGRVGGDGRQKTKGGEIKEDQKKKGSKKREGERGGEAPSKGGARRWRSTAGRKKTTATILGATLSKRGHRPQRTCLGCGAKEEQHRLIRLMIGEQGELKISRLADGRGGYLHRGGSCWQPLFRKKSLHQAFSLGNS